MALVLTRRPGEELLLRLESDVTADELQQPITRGIYIRVKGINGQQVKLDMEAPLSVSIVRTELLSRSRDLTNPHQSATDPAQGL